MPFLSRIAAATLLLGAMAAPALAQTGTPAATKPDAAAVQKTAPLHPVATTAPTAVPNQAKAATKDHVKGPATAEAAKTAPTPVAPVAPATKTN